jgi:drug/metabolite transporter (DMT)-like permease
VTTLRFYLWSFVAIAGCAVVVLAQSGEAEATTLGTILSILNLIAWSAYYLATKRARATVGTINWLLVMTLVSGVCVGVLALGFHQDFVPASSHEWWLLGALALGPATLGHFLVTWAQPRIHVAASSAVILGVPIIASIGAAIFLHEAFGPLQALGTVIALGGAAAAMRHLPPPVTEEATERYGEVVS